MENGQVVSHRVYFDQASVMEQLGADLVTATTSVPDISGQLLLPGSEGYDEARSVFNAMIDRRPAVIAQCAHRAGRRRGGPLRPRAGLEIAVRGGGHGVAGTAAIEGGLVIDLRRMNAVDRRPGRRVPSGSAAARR